MKKVRRFKLKRMILAGLCIYAALSLVKQEFAMRELKQKKIERQAKLSELESESAEIKKKIDNKEDIKYIEKIARDELNMVRPNEIVYEDINASDIGKERNKE